MSITPPPTKRPNPQRTASAGNCLQARALRGACRLACLAACVGTLWAILREACGEDSRVQKKLIETSGLLNTARLRTHLEVMEQQPFDGVVVDADGSNPKENRSISLRPAFSAEAWQREWFQNCVDDLNACTFRQFTCNFVLLGANPGNVDWFDDAGWASIAAHWRIAAWIARAGGIRGVAFDPEAYTAPFSQFGYGQQPQQRQHSFAEYYAKARERGRQVMQAATEENPAMVLLCYFMNSMTYPAAGQPEVRAALQHDDYGLYPAFIDGWLEVIPPTVTLVDGGENAFMYLYDSRSQYLEAAAAVRGAGQQLVSAELRARYRAQVQVGFGIYLDAYLNPPSAWWYIPARAGGTRVDRLRENSGSALGVTDEYVWVYGEQCRWWPAAGGKAKPHWSEALPGCVEALRGEREWARDPVTYGRRRIEDMGKAGTLVDRLTNGDFSLAEAAAQGGAAADWVAGPAGWFFWQDGATGTCTWDRDVGAAAKGAAATAKVKRGCLIQKVSVQPGERYAVRAACKLQGQGRAWVQVRWQAAEGKWVRGEFDRAFLPADAAPDWAEILGAVAVPEGTCQLGLFLQVSGEVAPEDRAWFDDVHLYKLD